MASTMQTFPRMLKMLRENSNIKEKREALTYIRSNSKKLGSAKTIKEEQYKDVCKLVVDAFANGNNDMQNEAYETLNVILRDFQGHTINLFEAMSQISQKSRLKILKLLDLMDEDMMSTFVYDSHTANFFNNCMCTVQVNTMPWTAPTACTDNLQPLIDAESRSLSDDQRLEEETISYCVTLLRKLYKVAARTTDDRVERFNALLMDKIMLLAYMGHKRQRGPALKLLQQALATNILSYARTKLAASWGQYVAALQATYCKRMLLLVSACDLDWAAQWNISIQFLGVELHRGAGLINNLLSVEEKAFKSTDTIIRRQAFLSWKLLVDNFALDPQELATARRIKLLCIPLNAKNSKTELIALTKLEVWWHVIIKLYKDIYKFVNPVITQFLNFCFGPLGDTPLLSSKFDVVASPGKRFFKTKVVAVDALCQLLVTKQENHTVFSPILEERLPHSISDAVFRECYKSIIHSVGEALLVLSQLTDTEMKNRYQLGKKLWTSLMNYIQNSKTEQKENMYKDMILVITELAAYAVDKPMIRNLIFDIILFEITNLSKEFNFLDDTLSGLFFKLLHTPVLIEAGKEHYNALKCLLWRSIKSPKEGTYYTHAFSCLKELHEKLHILANATDKNEFVIFELWLILAGTLIKYMDDKQEINEGNATEHNLKTVESIVIFPFMYIHLNNPKKVEELATAWKSLYKQFEMRTDLIATVKTNQILLHIASTMQRCVTQNDRSPYLTISCLDALLSSINYKLLIEVTEVPSIIHLIVDLITYFLSNKDVQECESALKALSAVIITVYGHSPEKAMSYLYICKPAIELMLETELTSLYKEVACTWECVINIFKGLEKQIDSDLLINYKKAIIEALHHENSDIQSQTESLFALLSVLSGSAKKILEEIGNETGKLDTLDMPEVIEDTEQNETQQNQANTVSVFFRGFQSPTVSVNKESDTNKRRASIDSDSQDYVEIRTDFKFDVNRLTEHQKESLKRRREDIPALYNDLSQSSSQDTQNLQEWFNNKNKLVENAEKAKSSKNDNDSVKDVLDDDANKENKIDVNDSETINKLIVENDINPTENVGQDLPLESVQKDVANNSENLRTDNEVTVIKKVSDNAEANTSVDVLDNDLNSNKQDEILNNENDQRLSPSMLEASKRRSRSTTILRSSMSPKLENVSDQPGQSKNSQALQRTLRTKVIQRKPGSMKEEKKGIKRKSTSDSEAEGTSLRQRRKTISGDITSNSSTSTQNSTVAMCLEGIIDEENLSQRTRNEISRLRINMAFDSPLSNYRRSKGHEENNKDSIAKKQCPENKVAKEKTRGRSRSYKIERVRESGETVDMNKELHSKSIEKTNNEVQSIDNSQPSKSTAGENQTQDDIEEIIESSQELSVLEKKCNEKQCFIKINKIGHTSPLMKNTEVTVEDEVVAVVILNNYDDDDKEVQTHICNDFDQNNGVKVSEPKNSNPVTENNLCDNEKDVINEVQKANEGPTFKSVLESPKTNFKWPIKHKVYAPHGRAAHMLGLVTKQARLEADSQVINLDDECITKKAKSKDIENDSTLAKKDQGLILKEVDKITTPCSSRQEKIFSNMRSSDYCSSPPTKLFSNLKNDGERIFSKADKSVDNVTIHTDAQIDKLGEDSLLEEDELPILEWSSANPPSLTASPSVSILKRQRQSIPEPDPECTTPNKRKRVSFADPPVSKEMGYEITSTDSPHKTTKFTSRSLLVRKDSPYRVKQIKQKTVSTDPDGKEKDVETDMANSSELDLQCERENVLLTKIADELEYLENVTMDSDAQTSCSPVEEESMEGFSTTDSKRNIIKIDNLSAEFEITQDATFSKHAELKSKNKLDRNKQNEIVETSNSPNINVETTVFHYSPTQDIFNATDAKHDTGVKVTEPNLDANTRNIQDTSIINHSADPLKFNITNDSIIKHSSDKQMDSENLEDTVDAGNLTPLNSSAGSDEIFCGRLMRTSTQAAESIEEQDTLPVTDSVFGSLPLSQDSQNTSELEITHPELLDSEHSIYPALISCKESITSIIEHLTNPLWVQHLSTYFVNRNIQTIGDLAQLSEREINRIPIKGNSKVDFVKSVLKCFEKKYTVKEVNAVKEGQMDTVSNNVSQSASKTIRNEVTELSVGEDKTEKKSVNQSNAADFRFNETSQASVADVSNMRSQISNEVAIHTGSIPVSTSDSNSSNVSTMQITNVQDHDVASSRAEKVTKNSSSVNENAVSTVQSTRTVGTCTSSDSIYVSKAQPNKETKSVGAQMALQDLLDEIDVNLVLESAARRCNPEKLLIHYKSKMKHVSQVELESETIRMLGIDNRKNCSEVTLKAACRACGVNRVLLRLPDIFGADKQFFVKVLNAYRKKIKASDCLNILEFDEVKEAVCQKCSSSELAEMLSQKLKEEEQQGIMKPMTELSSLNAMLKRMPMDVIISHTVANDELIPSRVVLDIALQNNGPNDIADALESQSSLVTKNVFDKLWSAEFAVDHIEKNSESKENLLKLFKAVSSKLSQQELLQAFYESMNVKLVVKQEND